MRAALAAGFPLICPRCRTRGPSGHELATVSVATVDDPPGLHRDGEHGGDDAIIEGELRCDQAACGARFPIVDGIPLLVAEPAGLMTGQIAALVARDLAPDVQARLAAAGPDDAPWPQLLEHLSIYMEAHWGDRVAPALDASTDPWRRLGTAPSPGFGLDAFAARISARAASPVARAVELGCSVGRGLAELARTAQIAVGVDLHVGALRRARRLLAGARVEFARRISGRHYAPAAVTPGDRVAPGALFVCADVLDPPLAPGSFDRVVAFNVFDSVRDPLRLLSVADSLCAPGGELLLASPYAFQSSIVDDAVRPDVRDPAAWLADRLRRGTGLESAYAIEDEAELPWMLRRDARAGNHYAAHYLRARKRR